jgi:hypothetical protein
MHTPHRSNVLVGAAQQRAATTSNSNNGGSFTHLGHGLLNATERSHEPPMSPLSPLDSGSDLSPSVDSRPATERFIIRSPRRNESGLRATLADPPHAADEHAPLLSPSSNTASQSLLKKEVRFSGLSLGSG